MRRKQSLRDLRTFLTTSRKIYAVIPALTVYAVWMTGLAYTSALHVSAGAPLVIRVAFTVASTLFTYFSIFALAKRIEVGKTSITWPFRYVGIILVSIIPICLFWLHYFDLKFVAVFVIYVRLAFLLSVSESIVGYLIFQIEKRAGELLNHQLALVSYEEKFRKTIFNHLHDNVQTRLFALGIQLEQIRQGLTEKDSSKIESIVSELEVIRTLDVRDFGMKMVPPISSVGLTPSLKRLLSSHEKVITGSITDNGDAELAKLQNAHYGLGIYRIAEQALINSLVHGGASKIDVEIVRTLNRIEIRILNNGKPLGSSNLTQGHGFAVIDAWVSKLGGDWSITNFDGQVLLFVRFKGLISQV